MIELLSYQIFLSIGIVFLQVWYTCLTNLDYIQATLIGGSLRGNGSGSGANVVEITVRYLPLWATLALGIYALSIVTIRVLSLKDCPEAAQELATEILAAKEKLRTKGFAF